MYINTSKVGHYRHLSYILADYAYHTSDIYDYVFENSHSIPVIDTNKSRGIVPERLLVNCMVGIDLRREFSSLYSLRKEIELIFTILEETLRCENVWYTENRNYYTAIDLKIIAYNLMVLSNIEAGENPSKINEIINY